MQLFVGKGGTGKTTMAAAAAVAAARENRRVLLVSLDRAHSLSLVLGVEPCRTGAASVRRVAERLDVVEIDTLGVLEARYRSLSSLATAAGAHEHDSGVAMLDPEELTSLPGFEDLAGLSEVRDLARRGEWDDVIVDCPSTADWLAMAMVPSLVGDYLERIWPKHRRVTAGIAGDPRLAVVVALLERMNTGAADVAAMLTDAETTTAVVVATPTAAVLAETSDLLAANAILGITTSMVIANMVVPQLGSAPTSVLGAHPAVFWFEAMRSEQEAELGRLRADAPTLRITTVQAALHEPVGLSSLDAIADDLVDPRNASGTEPFPRVEPAVRLESGSGLESVYVMTLHLPLVDPDTVSVGRVEDDVIVSAGLVRRRLRLASVLRRCDVVGASFDDDTLTMRFVPDPSVWPT